MKFDLEQWRDYYNTAHEMNKSEVVEERIYTDIVLKACSAYLDECGMKMNYIPNAHVTAWAKVARG